MLAWRKPDDYHIKSACGRFAVSRMNVSPHIWYVAWRVSNGLSPSHEIGSRQLAADAPDSERSTAIKALQAMCEGADAPLPL